MTTFFSSSCDQLREYVAVENHEDIDLDFLLAEMGKLVFAVGRDARLGGDCLIYLRGLHRLQMESCMYATPK